MKIVEAHEVNWVNMFRLVINPHSFGQSVENLFYLSFLIRDGMVELMFDNETREPIICKLTFLTEVRTTLIHDYSRSSP